MCLINRQQKVTILKKTDKVMVEMEPSASKARATPHWDVNVFFWRTSQHHQEQVISIFLLIHQAFHCLLLLWTVHTRYTYLIPLTHSNRHKPHHVGVTRDILILYNSI